MPLGVDLDGEVRKVDPDRWLASRFIADARRRADVVALYAFDNELARAAAMSGAAPAAEIRFVWWRETLEEVFEARTLRRHPVAEALAAAVVAHALPRAPFETMIETRIASLGEPGLAPADARNWAAGAQAPLAGLAARVLGGDPALAEPAGLAWGLHLLARTGRAEGAEVGLPAALAAAAAAARRLPAAAFPAALPATLARRQAGSELAKRVRLTWAVATGRI